ncbi:MAG: PcfJ domain-containing protein [Pseudomonadota bacterium]
MARRPLIHLDGTPLPAAVERHITEMGFQSTRAYLDWCQHNGFDPWLEKSRQEMALERDRHAEILAARAKQTRLHKKPKPFLEAVCAGEIHAHQIDRPAFKAVTEEIGAAKDDPAYRRSLKDMLLALLRYDSLIFGATPDGIPFIRGLIKLHDRKVLWLRPLADWKPRSKNAERQFGELTHHLFDRFGDVPVFMERAWLRTDRPSWRFRDWYVHLGRGHNLRTAKSPVRVTKRIAHEFLRAPADYTVEQAVRWGQLRAFGAGTATVHAVAATRIGRSFMNEAFWVTVLRFFAENPMLDPRQIGPIVDYLQNQRFEGNDVELRPGEWRREPPAQPGLTMRGRTVATVLRQVADWHASLGKVRDLPGSVYPAAAFTGIEIDRWLGPRKTRFAIRQLRSARDLALEGDALRHCVASYHWSCAQGHCSIWSLSASVGDTYERRQTIEVTKQGEIVQCRGLANCDPTSEEWSVVNAWASEVGLKISRYL